MTFLNLQYKCVQKPLYHFFHFNHIFGNNNMRQTTYIHVYVWKIEIFIKKTHNVCIKNDFRELDRLSSGKRQVINFKNAFLQYKSTDLKAKL